jgi:predicted RNase H-like HicB family nuclease
MARKERHVVKNPEGGWDVIKPNAERVSSHTDTKAEAVARAREICINEKAECVIHGENGKIQDSNSYGKDPCPPKDNKK